MLNTDYCERLLNSQKVKDNQEKDIILGGWQFLLYPHLFNGPGIEILPECL